MTYLEILGWARKGIQADIHRENFRIQQYMI